MDASALAHQDVSTDVVGLLLAHKAEVNSVGENKRAPLHNAAWEGHKDVAGLLLAHKAEVNSVDGDGATPLRRAIEESAHFSPASYSPSPHTEVAEVLRKAGGREERRRCRAV